MDKNERKKKMRKGLRIVGIVIAVLLVLLLCVYWISQAMVEKVDTYVRLEGIRFAQADYTYNIFDDVLYNAKEREIYYSEYGSGELIDEGAYESYGEQAVFFRKYFDCVINGRYEEYPELFTDGFFKRYTIPERFTMQKIYDIRVNLTDKIEAEVDGKQTTLYCYMVSYKIMNNNGTFRGDVGSDTVKPLYFEICTLGPNDTRIHTLNFVNHA